MTSCVVSKARPPADAVPVVATFFGVGLSTCIGVASPEVADGVAAGAGDSSADEGAVAISAAASSTREPDDACGATAGAGTRMAELG